MDNINQVQRDIIRTICWFDIFDYPMTLEEVWRYGIFEAKVSIDEVAINIAEMSKSLACSEVFYHLPGREEIVQERKKRFNYTDRKFKRVVRLAYFFQLLPFVELVAIGNLIGSHNLRSSGDIDLLVVSSHDTIWTTRFILASFVKALGLRPKKDHSTDTICLSFYVTSNSLDFRHLAIEQDIYFGYWLAFLTPIFDRNDVYNDLMAANAWMLSMLPNFVPQKNHYLRRVKATKSSFIGNFFWIFARFENIFKRIQLKLLPVELKSMANKDSRVIVSDEVLKFHANDRRSEFANRYAEKLKEYNV